MIGNDHAIVQGGQWSFMELNTMLPLAGYNLVQSIEIMGRASGNFATQCVAGLEVTEQGMLKCET